MFELRYFELIEKMRHAFTFTMAVTLLNRLLRTQGVNPLFAAVAHEHEAIVELLSRFNPCYDSLTHSLTHSPTHSITHSLTHSLARSLTQCIPNRLTYARIITCHSPTRTLVSHFHLLVSPCPHALTTTHLFAFASLRDQSHGRPRDECRG